MRGDQAALDEAVRDAREDLVVLEAAGLRLVGVDDEVVRLRQLLLRRHERPLAAGREERTASTAQLGRHQLLGRLGRASSREPSRAPCSRRTLRIDVVAFARTISSICLLATELLHDLRHVVGLHVGAVVVVDGDDRSPAAAAEALDRPDRELAVCARLAGVAAALVLERSRAPAARRRRRTTRSCTPRSGAHRPARGGTGRRTTRSTSRTRVSPRARRRPRG